MTVNISTPVAGSPGVARRFYEAVIFLACLVAVNFKQKTTREPDLETATGKSPKDEFCCFVNKLAQICDNKGGEHNHGNTITAFAVLQPGSIQYRFACNNRDRDSLEAVKEYITDILRTLGQTADSELNAVYQKILGRVVGFNRPRIESYINNLKKNVGFCIEACESEETSKAEEAVQDLRRLKELATSATDDTAINSTKFNAATLALLTTVNTLYTSPFEALIRTKARLDHDPDTRTPWSEFRHALGRLQSYNIAVSVLFYIRRRRHSLFEDFEVVYVPSSGPGETPNVRRSADGMAKRMGSEVPELWKLHTAHLEEIGLDKQIKNAAKPSEFQPIVHAEVNLLDSILTDMAQQNPYDDEPIRFYEESIFGKYIGCSKPTCRLCGLYFSAHPAGVQVRSSHMNVYYRWRAPDVYEHQGLAAEKRREQVLESMITSVRNVVVETMKKGEVARKAHDSFTTPSNPFSGVGGGAFRGSGIVSWALEAGRGMEMKGEGGEGDDLAERFGGLGI